MTRYGLRVFAAVLILAFGAFAFAPPALAQTSTASTTTYYEEDDEIPEEGAVACAWCAALGVAFPLILLALSIGIALWIWRDARERGNPSAALWAILGFLFNILGLVIYLIARKNMGPSVPPPPPPPPTVG